MNPLDKVMQVLVECRESAVKVRAGAAEAGLIAIATSQDDLISRIDEAIEILAWEMLP